MSKRTLFKSIQDSHTIPILGAVPQPVRTGYDHVVAHRVGKKFAVTAKEEGEITELSENHLTIKYNNGKEERVQIGQVYGVSTGKIVDNILITDYSIGKKVNPGDVVAYNPYFFTRDYLVPSQVLFKYSALANVTFMESNDTEEDSSAISERLGYQMKTNTIKVRSLVIPFENEIHNMLKVGDSVKTDTVLCTLVDAIFSENNMFGDDTLDTLSHLAQSTPRAKYEGTITKIEVLYKGDPTGENVSFSVRRLIQLHDKARRQLANKLKDGRATTGEVMESINIDGNALLDNHVAIKFYITSEDGQSVGDKIVVKSLDLLFS